jgi:hypothetical protein
MISPCTLHFIHSLGSQAPSRFGFTQCANATHSLSSMRREKYGTQKQNREV